MNERIKDMWMKCDDIPIRWPEQGSPVGVSEEDLEKFAQLIVRECIKLILVNKILDPKHEPTGPIEYIQNNSLELCAHTVKKHFGVEE